MSVVAVIVAAGKGERFGNAGKVMAPLAGRPVLAWSLDAFQQAESIDHIIIVVGEHTMQPIIDLTGDGTWMKVAAIVPGGESRAASTANGVMAVPGDADIILIHDAARPLIHPDQIEQCVAAARSNDGAILAAPVTDTIKRVADGYIRETIDRSTLWGAQTPQAFRADYMRSMVAHSLVTTDAVTDEASLAEMLGYQVAIVPGDASNIKITHPTDVIVAEALLRTRKDERS